jgi:hypothetical protein
VLEWVEKKAAKFVYHTDELNWEILKQRRKISHICAVFLAYCSELNLMAVGDRLERHYYLSRADHEREIRRRRRRTDIGIYSFVDRTIRLWNRLPAEFLGTVLCEQNIFRW